MNQTLLRAAYVSNSVETMSPARMIVALYDRLIVDLDRAEQAIVALDPSTAHECLIHAQSIVSELHDTLDPDGWTGARRLKDLYVFLLFELVNANVEKSATRVRGCRDLVVPLRDAWTTAAGLVPTRDGRA